MTNLNEEDLKKNVKDKDTWLRFIYLVVFGIAFNVVIYITFLTSLFQFLTKLFSGSSSPSMAEFGQNLATYQSQLTLYMTYASDEKPFPFAPFPQKAHATITSV